MGWLLVLRMTWFPACVVAAVQRPTTYLFAVERPLKPLFQIVRWLQWFNLPVVKRLQNLITLVTRNIPLFLSTVASSHHGNLTRSTETGMAQLRTWMLTTGKQIPAYLPTAEPLPILRLSALPGRGVLSTKACLHRAHERTRRTRSSMAHQRTWMGTCSARL